MKTSRMRILEWIIIIGVLAAVLLSVFAICGQNNGISNHVLRLLNDGWYRKDGNAIVAVKIPGTVELENGEDLVIYNDTLTADDGNRTISTRGALYRMRIYLGISPLYQYNDVSFRRNDQMRAKLNCEAVLPENPEGKQLAMTFKNTGNGVFYLDNIYIGKSSDIMMSRYLPDVLVLLIVFIMCVIGFICVGAHFYLASINMKDSRLGNSAWFLFLCGMWFVLDSSLMQKLSNESPLVCVLSFYAFMTMEIPMIFFIRNTDNLDRFRRLDVCIILLLLNVIVQSLIHFTLKVEFIDMLPFTHILQFGTSVVGAHLIWAQYKITRNPELKTVLQSSVLLAGTAVCELVFYWTAKRPSYGLLFECGILVFIIRLICAIAASMVSSLKFKTEALVYKRLSQEDRLTGLMNRRGFDDAIDNIELNLQNYENVALAFLDVNCLKYTNDRYGHGAGDELIIGAARCISRAFSPMGTCYRIGGDEFAVVIPDPPGGPEMWEKNLETTLNSYNKENRYKLSIAWGFSFLRRQDGTCRRISDWKYEADQQMYQKKQEQKQDQQDRGEEPI